MGKMIDFNAGHIFAKQIHILAIKTIRLIFSCTFHSMCQLLCSLKLFWAPSDPLSHSNGPFQFIRKRALELSFDELWTCFGFVRFTSFGWQMLANHHVHPFSCCLHVLLPQEPSVPLVAAAAGRRAGRRRKARAKAAKESSGAAYLKRKRNSKMEDKDWASNCFFEVSC